MAKVDKKKTHVPYKLSYMARTDTICFMGDEAIFKTARRLEGCTSYTGRQGPYMMVPATRQNFMIIEALHNPASVSESYITRRAECMTADVEQLEQWSNLNIPIKRRLMSHQNDFCARAVNMRGILNASEQGTGKTAMSIALHAAWNKSGPQRGLIVCPKSIMWQWASEFYKVMGADCPDVLPLSEYGMSVADKKEIILALSSSSDFDNTIVVVNYEILNDLQKVIKTNWRPTYVVYDESWKLKNPKSLSTVAAISIAENISSDGHILLLSGTPIGNDVGDLWSQIKMLEGPNCLEEHEDWMQDYATFRKIQTKAGRFINVPIGCRDPVGLMKRIEPVFFRATKATTLDLPEKVFDRIMFKMPKEVQDLYERVEEMGNTVFEPLSLSGERVTKLRLQQITGGCVPEIRDEMSTLVRSTVIPSPKRDWVMDFVRDTLLPNPEQRAIIWCKFNKEIEVLTADIAKILGDDAVFSVTRHTHDVDLNNAKEAFNDRKEGVAQVLVAQIKKLAYGHNLQSGDWNILYSHPWSYIDRDQLEDRTHRLGREGIVRYIELIAAGRWVDGKDEQKYVKSIDEEILDTIRRKENLADRLGPDTVGDN